ncbi:hypothetical protein JKP88DRAFT_347200 [Tribonema minus]|uniref:Uncharacterized protein n=1 Tax=Tribonema minus TaxID=303371 RepID=A0A836C7J9_9STRA|nr:hypothetical protein JKP88DRAFT_347200 [Tribonema minus]
MREISAALLLVVMLATAPKVVVAAGESAGTDRFSPEGLRLEARKRNLKAALRYDPVTMADKIDVVDQKVDVLDKKMDEMCMLQMIHMGATGLMLLSMAFDMYVKQMGK